MYEDEGTYVENKQTEVDGYGLVNEISYGDHVSTKFTSVVENGTATLTAEKSTGTYAGYEQNKNTTFIVNVSAESAAVTAKNGSQALTMVKMNSKDEVLNAQLSSGEFAYYYDAAPAIETYALEAEDEFAAMMEGKVTSPKLYVKFAETDSQQNAQTLILEGFENVDAGLPANEPDASLSAPENLRDVTEEKTPTSNVIAWDAVEGAISYDLRVDGIPASAATAMWLTRPILWVTTGRALPASAVARPVRIPLWMFPKTASTSIPSCGPWKRASPTAWATASSV